MQLIDPTVPARQHHNRRAPPVQSISNLRIGMLSNAKLNADRLLMLTAEHFSARHQCSVSPLVFKQNASAPADKSTIEQLTSSCDLLLTANGD